MIRNLQVKVCAFAFICTTFSFMSTSFAVSGNEAASSMPFWPKFPAHWSLAPKGLKYIRPLGLDLQALVLAEGKGFWVLASGEQDVIFAAPPRLSPAWRVSCPEQLCELTRVDDRLSADFAGDMRLVFGTTKPSEQQDAKPVLGKQAYEAAWAFLIGLQSETSLDDKVAAKDAHKEAQALEAFSHQGMALALNSDVLSLPQEATKERALTRAQKAPHDMLQGFR